LAGQAEGKILENILFLAGPTGLPDPTDRDDLLRGNKSDYFNLELKRVRDRGGLFYNWLGF
jgi:hypothetical protein